MKPRERDKTGEQDVFRSWLDQIIDMNHALVKLSRAIDWGFLEQRFGAVYEDGPGRPPTRLMAGLAILKHAHDLPTRPCASAGSITPIISISAARRFFRHELPLDRSSLTRWRRRMGEGTAQSALARESGCATRTQTMKPKDLARVVIDTTVQSKERLSRGSPSVS